MKKFGIIGATTLAIALASVGVGAGTAAACAGCGDPGTGSSTGSSTAVFLDLLMRLTTGSAAGSNGAAPHIPN
ncbi:hypothetical protein [Nocardia flavorosea]|uniref:Small secreted domain DUF320 n=1 Tax=Nocardia flavorosea TaxID=53429 RepID=A0A846YFD2_9NOCA|nr:hypothetical protein [Nocardia flavorosea]NKY55868.1 hypothetical protein [Nocardia flavorosea]